MKKNLTLLILLLSILAGNPIKTQTSDNAIKQLDSSVKQNTKAVSTLDKGIKALTDTVGKKLYAVSVAAPCRPCELDWFRILIILLPVILFLILAFYFLRWLKREKFKLSDALSADIPGPELTTTISTITNPKDPTKTVTTETQEPNYPKSSSRLIAFLTALSAIVIALCLITLYTYGYITKNENLQQIDELWKIIAGLGIGVVPYVSKIITEKKQNNL